MPAWYTYPITNPYSTVQVAGNSDTPHYAVDIGTPFHTPLTAIKSGTVVQADYAAWGGEIFIKPDDGSTEYYYYHPDLLEVQTGQHVTAGQEIALSGGENPGYPGALHPAQPIWSTGPHTHVGYFTNWAQTPLGTRPFGPDITPTIQSLVTKGIAGSQTSGGSTGNTNPTGTVPSVQTPTGAVVTANDISGVPGAVQSGILRVGIFLIAIIIILGGFYVAFHTQINSAVKTGVETAAKVALV